MTDAYPEDWDDDEKRMPRAYEDRGFSTRYLFGDDIAHILPVALGPALCGKDPDTCCALGCNACMWLGGGDWTEVMHARALPICAECEETLERAYRLTTNRVEEG